MYTVHQIVLGKKLDVGWIHLAQNRVQWWDFDKTT
jgi:hypothetical protein